MVPSLPLLSCELSMSVEKNPDRKKKEPSNPSIALFMNNQNLFNLVKSNTCFKGEGLCIDLIWTNRKYSFKNACSYETRLSDHHYLISSVMKTTFKSEEPKKSIYCDYSNFSSEFFVDDFMSSICQEKHDYSDFEKKFIGTLKVGFSPSKKIFYYLLQWEPFKNNEQCFLFHLKSSFRSQDI